MEETFAFIFLSRLLFAYIRWGAKWQTWIPSGDSMYNTPDGPEAKKQEKKTKKYTHVKNRLSV